MNAYDLMTAIQRTLPQRIEEVFPGYLNRGGCILATRASIEIMQYFGLRPKALAVTVFACNDQFKDRVMKEGRWPDPAELVQWEKEDGSWTVGIGYDGQKTQPGRWAGHLVTVCDGWMLDLTIGQASRPQRNMTLPQSWILEVWDDVTSGQQRLMGEHKGGASVVYDARPNDTSYTVAPDWKDRERHQLICGPVIRSLRSELTTMSRLMGVPVDGA